MDIWMVESVEESNVVEEQIIRLVVVVNEILYRSLSDNSLKE